MRLEGKVAVVTGAARGIGAAVAARFAQEGAAVVCADVLEDELLETVAAITATGGTCRALVADVAAGEDNERLVGEAMLRFGRLDVFHANAAVQVMGGLGETDPADWDRMHAVNVRGVAHGIRFAVPAMVESGGGSIIITASLLGIVGDPDLPFYGATKGALRSLCRAVAAAHGPDGVRCNTICPGDVETELLKDFFEFQPDPVESRRRITERYPLRRFATPLDVANAALFLAGDESAYVTGTDLTVDGGLLARIY